jgi:hypothetical protein
MPKCSGAANGARQHTVEKIAPEALRRAPACWLGSDSFGLPAAVAGRARLTVVAASKPQLFLFSLPAPLRSHARSSEEATALLGGMDISSVVGLGDAP